MGGEESQPSSLPNILLEVNPDNTPGGERTEESTAKDAKRLLGTVEKQNKAIAVPPEADADGWISTKSLLESLTAQGIKLSMRTLQNWGDKHEATKPDFEPPYTAKKDVKGNWVWKPA